MGLLVEALRAGLGNKKVFHGKVAPKIYLCDFFFSFLLSRPRPLGKCMHTLKKPAAASSEKLFMPNVSGRQNHLKLQSRLEKGLLIPKMHLFKI